MYFIFSGVNTSTPQKCNLLVFPPFPRLISPPNLTPPHRPRKTSMQKLTNYKQVASKRDPASLSLSKPPPRIKNIP
ncbi:hypothetical protein K469DRAFT_282922 [Zopfia rhizophila CBS 207.26]|uniref:Uncharacterized protein n=1 Tax=Zopfia rhizophila CBS 207.26 TaxID=1314779 RepID=A0A6A6EPU5_9PEZI|nr:hypothetical protein K469DRAFT_282922 [Zopfia rhizophila CBS 207.26]